MHIDLTVVNIVVFVILVMLVFMFFGAIIRAIVTIFELVSGKKTEIHFRR